MLDRVIRAYELEGWRVRLGSPRLFTMGVHPIGEATHPTPQTGLSLRDLGFTLTDVHAFRLIGDALRPRRGLIIGNACGLSAACLGTMLAPMSLDVIDAEVEGEMSREGADLTRRVAQRLDLDVQVTRGYSPRDLPDAMRFDAYDLVFIDGLHHNGQIIADYAGVADRLAERCAVVFHDIGLCGLDEGWARIRTLGAARGLAGYDLTFTDYGSTALLRGLPELESMLSLVCPPLRAMNERYAVGTEWSDPDGFEERPVLIVPPGRRIAFYGAGHDLAPYEPFLRAHPELVAGVIDDDSSRWGQDRFGVRIVGPGDIDFNSLHAVVISTRSHASAVRTALAQRAPLTPVLPGDGRPHPVDVLATLSGAPLREAPAHAAPERMVEATA